MVIFPNEEKVIKSNLLTKAERLWLFRGQNLFTVAAYWTRACWLCWRNCCNNDVHKRTVSMPKKKANCTDIVQQFISFSVKQTNSTPGGVLNLTSFTGNPMTRLAILGLQFFMDHTAHKILCLCIKLNSKFVGFFPPLFSHKHPVQRPS